MRCYAIAPRGIGKPVGARLIEPGWPLAEGETFKTDNWNENMVLAADGKSLRPANRSDLEPPKAAPAEKLAAFLRNNPDVAALVDG